MADNAPETGAGDATKKGKKGGTFQKYKVWILSGGALLVVVVLMVVKKSAASTASTSTATGSDIDPATGYLAGSTADLAALSSGGSTEGTASSGTTGPTGATGATGATGPAGPAGPSGTTTTTAPTQTLPLQGTPAAGPAAPIAAPVSNSYTVQPGQSLFSISQKFYGTGNDWETIYNANKGAVGSNPSLIHPGLKLTIPNKPS